MTRIVAVAVLFASLSTGLTNGCGEVEADLPEWAWYLPDCPGYQTLGLAAWQHRRAGRMVRNLQDSHQVTELIETYQTGWGSRALAEIRTLVTACQHYESGGYDDPAAFREQLTVLETDFAGDESLLVERVRLAPPQPMLIGYAATVRHGDVVATIRAVGLTRAELKQRARAAVARIG